MTKKVDATKSSGLVTVRRTVLGQTEMAEETIDVRAFATEVARVRVGKGVTIGLPNYSSARVDVSIELPCYREEAVDVFFQLTGKVEELLTQEASKIEAMVNPPKNTDTDNLLI